MKLSRRNFLKLTGITVVGLYVPKSSSSSVLYGYSCVDEAITKVHRFPAKCRKMRDELFVKGMKLFAEHNEREVVKTRIEDMGLVEQEDTQDKAYYAYVSKCTLFLKPKAA